MAAPEMMPKIHHDVLRGKEALARQQTMGPSLRHRSIIQAKAYKARVRSYEICRARPINAFRIHSSRAFCSHSQMRLSLLWFSAALASSFCLEKGPRRYILYI